MLNPDVTNYQRRKNKLFARSFVEVPKIPEGTHTYLASGMDETRPEKTKYILVTANGGLPYLFGMDIDAANLLNPEMTNYNISRSCVVEHSECQPSTIRRNEATSSEKIALFAMRLHALGNNPATWELLPPPSDQPSRIIALSSRQVDPFIILKDNPGSGNYFIFFVPEPFTETTEWALANAAPWKFELQFMCGKCLQIPYIRRRDD